MMRKFFVIIFTLLIIPNAYAEIKNCKYKLDMYKNEDILMSLVEDPNYSYKNANGKICFIEGGMPSIAFGLKNGKRTDAELIWSYGGWIGLEIYISDYNALEDVMGSLDDNLFYNNEDVEASTLNLLKKKKLTLDITTYHENGNVDVRYVVKNGKGHVAQYLKDGATFIYIPIKNYQFNGTAKIHTTSGKLYATLKYKNDKLISGKCASKRENGEEWTKAEIDNWENSEYDIEDIDYCGELDDLEETDEDEDDF